MQPDEPLNYSAITELADGDVAFMKEFIESMQTTLTDFDRDFRMHLLERNTEKLRAMVHNMKPTLEGFGMHSLTEHIRTARELAHAAHCDERQLRSSADDVRRAIAELKGYLRVKADGLP